MVRCIGFNTMLKTFDIRTDAKKWERAVERKLEKCDSADYSEMPIHLNNNKEFLLQKKQTAKNIYYILKNELDYFKIKFISNG